MIPAFLRSLASQVRTLIAAGRAVHVTEADAAELELLAGLWAGKKPIEDAAQGRSIEYSKVTPDDFAHAWLRLSTIGRIWDGPHMVFDGRLYNERQARCSVCVELLAISSHVRIRRDPPQPMSGAKLELSLAFGIPADPHAGTIEGARTAWSFGVEQLSAPLHDAMQEAIAGGKAGICHPYVELVGKYQRELEGMK